MKRQPRRRTTARSTARSRTTTARAKRQRASHPRPNTRSGPLTSGLAPGMQSINTYLAVANIAATMEFLEKAFGFRRGVVLPGDDGQLRYAEMRHGASVVMLIRKGDATTATGGASALYTYVDDVDAAAAQARDAGAGVADTEDTSWGDRAAVITDPDGYRWVLATFKKLAPFS